VYLSTLKKKHLSMYTSLKKFTSISLSKQIPTFTSIVQN
jgi:hypothetical protein